MDKKPSLPSSSKNQSPLSCHSEERRHSLLTLNVYRLRICRVKLLQLSTLGPVCKPQGEATTALC